MKSIWKQKINFLCSYDNFIKVKLPLIPQIAFLGASNVGKSSLINALCNKSNLAKISKTPGRTRFANFFNVADKLILVDLPGYGYARYDEKKINKIILEYLVFSQNQNSLINLLIDIRRGLRPNDVDILSEISFYQLNLQIIITKQDKLNKRDQLLSNNLLIQNLKNLKVKSNIINTSSSKNIGISEFKKSIYNFLI